MQIEVNWYVHRRCLRCGYEADEACLRRHAYIEHGESLIGTPTDFVRSVTEFALKMGPIIRYVDIDPPWVCLTGDHAPE